jgi:hypothetical protein
MAVFDLYSKRRKRALGDISDVYTYDKIPEQEALTSRYRPEVGGPSEFGTNFGRSRNTENPGTLTSLP